MNKHKDLLVHRHITKIGLTDSGGLLIRFDDESHTFIDPSTFKNINEKYDYLRCEGYFNEEE